ncbi:unnamed protein product [Owenia fusiformis]|uniref:Uncharacterized protein n=1 Tax=Owenia fusiformis TaxID=6347 RepID=A0A8J1XRT7_OWEFU|nr:unnamed protein product [Owenia fusiformis]
MLNNSALVNITTLLGVVLSLNTTEHMNFTTDMTRSNYSEPLNSTTVNPTTLKTTLSLEEGDEEAEPRILTMEDHIEYKASEAIWKYVSPFLIFGGLIGNTLSIVVLMCSKMRQTTSSLYLSTLAVSDSLVLVLGLGRHWMRSVVGTDIREVEEWLCKAHLFLLYSAVDFSAWILVAVTIDRVITVYFPLQSKRISTRTSTCVTMVVIFVVILLINGHFLFTHGTFYLDWYGTVYTYLCTYIDDNDFFHNTIWTWLDLSVASLVPFLMLIICNTLIIVKLMRSQKRRQEMNVSSSRTDHTRSMTIMLLAISFIFVILTSPIVIYLKGHQESTKDRSPLAEARDKLVWAIVNMFLYLNNAINFFMYCLSGGRFREEMRKLFCCVGIGMQRQTSYTGGYTKQSSLNGSTTQTVPTVSSDVSRKTADVTTKL